jgi:hypothetical protein
VDVPSCQPADNPRTRNRRMADGNHILQLCLEDTILISLYSLFSSFHLPVSSVFFPPPRYLRRRWVSKNIPVEILTRTNSDQRITIRQRREDTDPILCQHVLLYSPSPTASPSLHPGRRRPIAGHGAKRGKSLLTRSNSQIVLVPP